MNTLDRFRMALTAIASLDPNSPDAPAIAFEALKDDDEWDYEVIFEPEFMELIDIIAFEPAEIPDNILQFPGKSDE